MKIHILFEHGPDLRPFGSASIRLLRPLLHPSLADQVEVTSGVAYYGQKVDIVIVDRLWRNDISMQEIRILVAKIREAGARLVYAIDDNYFDIPPDHNVQFSQEKIQVVEFLLHQADCVLVTTPFLKERFSEFNDQIIVLPHALDERLLVPRPTEANRSPWRKKRKIIGYMGTYTHDADLMMVIPALRTIWENHKDEVEFQIIGCAEDPATKLAMAGLPVQFIQTNPGEEEYPLFMLWYTGKIDWDIGIAPLRDISFNQAKSDIKLLDYSAIGIPGVFSNTTAYRSSIRRQENGLLVDNRIEDWVESLELLLNDDELRMRLARNAYQELIDQRTLKNCSHRWLSALQNAFPHIDPEIKKTATIVIPTKNAEPYLHETLQAIFSQITQIDYEVLVIDSGSKDQTLEILASYPLRVIQIPPASFNHGLTRNLGAQEARPESEFIVYLSQDAKPYDEYWLENLTRPFFEIPAVGGVFSRHIARPNASASVVRQLTQLTQSGGEKRIIKTMPSTLEEYEANRFFYNFFSNTSSAIRAKVWKKYPFQKVDFAEDALWADTVIKQGHSIVFEPASIVLHSHSYNIIEQFRQNVDHANGFDQLFHPDVFHDWRIWLKQFLGLPLQIYQDSHYVLSSPLFSKHSSWYKISMILFSIPWQIATVTGSFIGANLGNMPGWIKLIFSRQERLKNK